MNSIQRAARMLAERRERRAHDARLRQLRSTPSGRAMLAYENGETSLTLDLADNVADFAVWAVEELVLPPDPDHPRGSRWTLEHITAAPTAPKPTTTGVAPDGIGGSWSRTPPTTTRSVYTFQREPMATKAPKG